MPQTVAELIRAQAQVMWWCDAGGHSGQLDLERVANLRGPDTVLANRRTPCPIPGCPGRVTFKDHTHVFARSLDTIAVHDPEGHSNFARAAMMSSQNGRASSSNGECASGSMSLAAFSITATASVVLSIVAR